MEYFYSKYTGEELEERLDRIDDIPELLAEMLTGKNYTTPEDALCIVKKYVPTIYENIPIDNNTIYWANTNDGKVLKARIELSGNTDVEGECLWEKKTNTDGKEYLYSKLPVITAEGITMYADGEGLDIPSIYAGIPFDGVTIHFNKEGKVEVIGGTEGGVSNFWDLNDIPSWITNTKPIYSYSEIKGTPDLSNYVTKSYVDDNFVTFTLDEVITGIKSFTNGLKIGESSIKQLQEDVIYIDANLVVRGGVTMYYDDGEIDIPNIKDQIGPAGYNEKGLASFDQTYFTINNGHVSLIEGAVGLNEDELLNYLTNNKYATQSWVETKGFALNSDLTILSTKVNDFLEGSDTDNIINKWKELEAFLTGLDGSNDLATILSWKADKTYVDETFVTIGGDTEQTITGPKNFIGGLKVNGSPIYYDTDKKYWKLEGDLLITGGLTMYGNDSDFVASTIMNAILYDDSTLGINANGELYVKGGTGGGISSVTSQMIVDALGYTPASATALSGYLPLSGGTITNNSAVPLTINANNDGQVGLFLQSKGNNKTYVGWDTSRGACLYEFASDSHIGILNGVPKFNSNTIWHSGNDGSGSGLDADLLDGVHLMGASGGFGIMQALPRNYTTANQFFGNGNIVIFDPAPTDVTGWGSHSTVLSLGHKETRNHQLIFSIYDGSPMPRYRRNIDGVWSEVRTFAFLDDNVASATKLQTARTIWGQSFDGTGNVDDSIISAKSTFNIFANTSKEILSYNTTNKFLSIGYGTLASSFTTYIHGYNINLRYGASGTDGLILNSVGNVGIGTTNPREKLEVSNYALIGGNIIVGGGAIGFNRNTYQGGRYDTKYQGWQIDIGNNTLNFYTEGSLGNGTKVKFDASGNILATGGVTMYSDQRKKTILNHVELSLQQVANAPLIEHYYNSDQNKTTHIGSIAQYWAEMNDWFCKKDSEGYYTMEIQNAALASAISVARELVKFETETDRRIRLLEKENKRLKEEVEFLKLNAA